jgi:hypothetical protein
MRKRTIVIIVAPFAILAIVVAALPIAYYGNMILVSAFHLRPKQADIPGNYSVSTEWGSATLNVRSDHTFTETVRSKQFGDRVISGTWAFENQFPSSIGVATNFRPFVDILHDKPQQFDYGTEDFNVNVLGTISDEQDPDFGISFYKDKH